MALETKKKKWVLSGGPFDGEKHSLATPTTMVFTAKGMTGRYRRGEFYTNIPPNQPQLLFYEEDNTYANDACLFWEEMA